MKRLLAAVVLGQLATGTAMAESLYVGDTFVLSSTCSTFSVGDFGYSVYRPRGTALGNGTTHSYFSYTTSRSGNTLERRSGDFADGAPLHVHGAASKAAVVDDEPGTATNWDQVPAVIAATTKSIKVDATITGLFGVAGCVVTLRANLAKQ